MAKGRGDKYDEEMQRAIAARDPEVAKKSKWAAPSKGKTPNPAKDHVQYVHKSLLGGEKRFYDGDAKRASKGMK